MWVPPGYVLCTDRTCDAYRMVMGRPHAHLEGYERWLIDEDRSGRTQRHS